MSDEKVICNDGYKPKHEGYQPEKKSLDTHKPDVKGGYQPTKSEGDSPINRPAPPKEE